MSYRGPRAKLSRRLGVALTPKAERVMIRKSYGPGQHGQRRRRAPSEYSLQLLEKQKLKFQYNVTEKQLRKYFFIAQRMKGNPADNVIQLLERRLDNIIHRGGFAPTIYAARQLVTHGHVLVDGKRVNKPCYSIKTTEIVSLRDKSKNIPIVGEALTQANPPAYMETNKEQFTARLSRLPLRNEVPVVCELQLVTEWYSR